MKKIAILVFLTGLSITNYAQSTCTSAIVVTPSSTSCNFITYSTLDPEMWFSFQATSNAASININNAATFGTNAPHIHRVTLYAGSCSGLTILDEDELGAVSIAKELNIDVTELTSGNTYFIKAERAGSMPCPGAICGIGPAVFDLCVRSVNLFIPPDGQEPQGSLLYYQNKGQILGTDNIPRTDIKAYVGNTSPAMYFRSSDVSFVYHKGDTVVSVPDTAYRFDMTFLNANSSSFVFKAGKTESKENYFVGHTKDGVINCEGYQRMVYPDIYNNIDFQSFSKINGGNKNYFIVRPGGNLNDIKLFFPGVSQIQLSPNQKEITLVTPRGILKFEIDDAFRIQPNGSQNPRNVTFNISGNQVGFDLNSSLSSGDILVLSFGPPLTIPPIAGITNHWSTYLGGGTIDYTYDVTIDASNNVYSCGETWSSQTTFPVTNGIDITYNGNADGFVAKFKPDRGREWITYWGGASSDIVRSVTYIQPAGVVAFTGNTSSSQTALFPLFNPGGGAYFDGTFISSASLFVAKITSGGSINLWCSYFAQGNTEIHTCTSDQLGNMYIGGVVFDFGDANFPTANPSGSYNQSYQGGGNDAFISKFGPTNALIWSTFFGGNNLATGGISEETNGMVTDAANNLYVTGTCGSFSTFDNSQILSPPCTTNPTPFLFPSVAPIGNAYQQGNQGLPGLGDAWIAKFNPSGGIMWSTLFGGNGTEVWDGTVHNYDGVAINPLNGDIWLVGSSQPGSNFPIVPLTVAGAYNQSIHMGGYDAFIAKFNSSFELKYSTLYGGSGNDGGMGIDVGGNKAYIAGWTESTNFPRKTKGGSYNQSSLGGLRDAFLIELGPSGKRTWATFYGGSALDHTWAFAVDATADNIIIGGETASNNFPVADPPGPNDWTDINLDGSIDGFISNFNYVCFICLREMEPDDPTVAYNYDGITLFPNPSSIAITVKTDFVIPYEIIVYNMLGEIVYFGKNIVEQERDIDVSVLPSGIYVVKATAGETVVTAKFIKE